MTPDYVFVIFYYRSFRTHSSLISPNQIISYRLEKNLFIAWTRSETKVVNIINIEVVTLGISGPQFKKLAGQNTTKVVLVIFSPLAFERAEHTCPTYRKINYIINEGNLPLFPDGPNYIYDGCILQKCCFMHDWLQT